MVNKAERIHKSEQARKRRHSVRDVVEKRTQREYQRLRKLRLQRNKHK
ncbi:MAG: hypothetical protein ACO397_04655 [Gammaproteobacteria bacterium]